MENPPYHVNSIFNHYLMVYIYFHFDIFAEENLSFKYINFMLQIHCSLFSLMLQSLFGGKQSNLNLFLLKIENLRQKSFFFSDDAEWNSKYFWKIISADVKPYKNKKEMRSESGSWKCCFFIYFLHKADTLAVLTNTLYPSWYCLLRTGGRGRGRVLNGQNLLSVTKVICQQSLNLLTWY